MKGVGLYGRSPTSLLAILERCAVPLTQPPSGREEAAEGGDSGRAPTKEGSGRPGKARRTVTWLFNELTFLSSSWDLEPSILRLDLSQMLNLVK